jgi:hypothetical protein
VQLGITLIGILSGAYGGATIAEELARFLGQSPTLLRVCAGDHRYHGADAHVSEHRRGRRGRK